MNDLISRKEAIDALFELYEYQRDIDPTEAADLVRQGIYLAEKKIEELPSAQQWTPCSERPPKDGSEVLVTTSWNDVCKAWYSNGIWRAEFINEYNDGEILAWMPLPKPWRGEENGKPT